MWKPPVGWMPEKTVSIRPSIPRRARVSRRLRRPSLRAHTMPLTDGLNSDPDGASKAREARMNRLLLAIGGGLALGGCYVEEVRPTPPPQPPPSAVVAAPLPSQQYQVQAQVDYSYQSQAQVEYDTSPLP